MHTSALLTSALAVGALAFPNQLDKRQQATVTVTVTVGARPPAWTPPRFSSTRGPANAPPPAWTPPRLGASRASASASRAAAASTRPTVSSSSSSSPSGTPPVVGPIQTGLSSISVPSVGVPSVSTPSVGVPSGTGAPSGVVPSVGIPSVSAPGSTDVVSGASSSAPTPAPSSTPDLGDRVTGEAQAALSVGPEYQQALLYHHNAARANHNAGPLVWDDSVAQVAAQCANTCDFAHFIPAGVQQGQNLYTTSGDNFNVTAAVTESWYKSELPPMVPYFGQPNIPNDVFGRVGHLTQLLWKATTRVGCVSIDCGNRMTVNGASSNLNKFTVCNYAPPGNVGGQYAINVQAPIDPNDLGSWTD